MTRTAPPSSAALLLLASLLLLPPLAGCGRGAPKLGKVSGTVRLEGEPLPGARVTFQPKAGGSPSIAVTDDSGGYTLMYAADLPGALPGEHQVQITTYRQEHRDGFDPIEHPERLPARYHAESTLVETVTGGSQTIDFDLESR